MSSPRVMHSGPEVLRHGLVFHPSGSYWSLMSQQHRTRNIWCLSSPEPELSASPITIKVDSDTLTTQFDNPTHSDCTVIASDPSGADIPATFQCHRVVLSALSNVLAEALSLPGNQLTISSPVAAVETFLRTLYSGQVTAEGVTELLPVLNLAHMYEIQPLERAIVQQISCNLGPGNCCLFISELLKYNCTEPHVSGADPNCFQKLYDSCLKAIATHFQSIFIDSKSKDYMLLDHTVLAAVLQRDDVIVESEEVVLNVAIGWIQAMSPELTAREKELVLGAVRFDLLSDVELADAPDKMPGSPTVEDLTFQAARRRLKRYAIADSFRLYTKPGLLVGEAMAAWTVANTFDSTLLAMPSSLSAAHTVSSPKFVLHGLQWSINLQINHPFLSIWLHHFPVLTNQEAFEQTHMPMAILGERADAPLLAFDMTLELVAFEASTENVVRSSNFKLNTPPDPKTSVGWKEFVMASDIHKFEHEGHHLHLNLILPDTGGMC